MKQSAVEFLHSEYKRIIGDTLVDIQKVFAISDSFAKAKEMEKQQIIDAHISGMEFIAVDPNHYYNDSEQYYNETFKNK